ncbi:MAG: S26 family signal peptidase [Phycisphaerales bacterium]
MSEQQQHGTGGGGQGADVGSGASGARGHTHGGIRETLVSLVIALAVAFIAKAYIIEAFVIPTGSMAPTLLGQHLRARSPQSGFDWASNPWYYDTRLGVPTVQQPPPPEAAGGRGLRPPVLTDPMSTSVPNDPAWDITSPRRRGWSVPARQSLRAGDRILVQKYLPAFSSPERWDVIVFRNPENSRENFIKRMIGLPLERVLLLDGDVFTRPLREGADGALEVSGEWTIQRKPVRHQESLWFPIYSSEYAPIDPERDGTRWFADPWVGGGVDDGSGGGSGGGSGWESDGISYAHTGDGTGVLRWDSLNWPVTDRVWYNETPYGGQRGFFPVGDLRVRGGIEAEGSGVTVSAVIETRQHAFRARFETDRVVLEARRDVAVPEGLGDGLVAMGEWTVVGTAPIEGARMGAMLDVELWHVDQALRVVVDGRTVIEWAYDWTPEQRAFFVTGSPMEDLMISEEEFEEDGGVTPARHVFLSPSLYRHAEPRVRWEVRGRARMHRVGLDRDLWYQPNAYSGSRGTAAMGTHPQHPADLKRDQFFVLGDNSPASRDSRLWNMLDPWIEDQILPDGSTGVVHRKLLMGKAFFVYFPALERFNGIPVPDFGRMRWIR